MRSSQERSAGAGKWLVVLTPPLLFLCVHPGAQHGEGQKQRQRTDIRTSQRERLGLDLSSLTLSYLLHAPRVNVKAR